jgi:branched-chain amino acid aminotransferase
VTPRVALPRSVAWIDGRLREPAEVPLADRAARGGEGLFETFRVDRGQPLHWNRHMERLVISAAELGFPVPPHPDVLRGALGEVLASAGLADAQAAARITVTRGAPGRRPGHPGVWVEAEPLENRRWPGARTQSARVVFSRRVFGAGFLARYKTTSRLAYEICREEARAAHADEVLLVDAHDRVLEGSVSNVFAVIGGRLLTPPVSLPLLPGITRAVTLERARALGIDAAEMELTREQLVSAEELIVTNSLQQIVPVGRLGGRELPNRAIGLRLAASERSADARESSSR